jgi:hypothetical protein
VYPHTKATPAYWIPFGKMPVAFGRIRIPLEV